MRVLQSNRQRRINVRELVMESLNDRHREEDKQDTEVEWRDDGC